MKFLRFARHWIWLAPLALGVAFIAAGFIGTFPKFFEQFASD